MPAGGFLLIYFLTLRGFNSHAFVSMAVFDLACQLHPA